MSNSFDRLDNNLSHEGGELSDLETKIRQAAGYVVPSDTFRARVLEAARDRAQSASNNRRVFGAALAMIFGLVLALQVTEYLRAKCESRIVWPSEIDAQVEKLNETPGVGPNWAPYEAVRELRSSSNLQWSDSDVSATIK